jgi:Tfp pilus assembly protein PilF
MKKYDEKDDFLQIADKLISKQKFGEALNYLQRIIETDNKNEKALILMKQVKKIVEYQNREIFGATNLDMDPWLE